MAPAETLGGGGGGGREPVCDEEPGGLWVGGRQQGRRRAGGLRLSLGGTGTDAAFGPGNWRGVNIGFEKPTQAAVEAGLGREAGRPVSNG